MRAPVCLKIEHGNHTDLTLCWCEVILFRNLRTCSESRLNILYLKCCRGCWNFEVYDVFLFFIFFSLSLSVGFLSSSFLFCFVFYLYLFCLFLCRTTSFWKVPDREWYSALIHRHALVMPCRLCRRSRFNYLWFCMVFYDNKLTCSSKTYFVDVCMCVRACVCVRARLCVYVCVCTKLW